MKMRTKAVMAVVMCLALVVPIAAVAAGNDGNGNAGNGKNGSGGNGQQEGTGAPGNGNGTPKGSGWKETIRERWQERRQERMENRQQMMGRLQERMKQMWKEHRHIGEYSYDSATRTAIGVFVSFNLDNETGTILDYTLRYTPDANGTVVFETVSVEGDAAPGEPKIHGSVARFDIGNVSVSAHDNPTGLLMLKSEGNSTLTLVLGEGNQIRLEVNATIQQRQQIIGIDGSARGAIIVSRGNYTIDNQTITVALRDEGKVIFMARPNGEEVHDYIAEGIQNGTIGAEIRVGRGRGKDVVAFANVEIDATYDENSSMVTLNVESAEHRGRILMVTVDNDTVNQGTLKIIYDGKEIRPVGTWRELVGHSNNSTDDATAAYLIRPCEGGYCIFIAVPRFSDHTITIQGMAEVITPVAIGAIFVAAIVIVVAAVIMFRKRKEEGL